jgi:hypothetical protein
LYLVDKINIIYQRQGQDAAEPVYSDGLFGDLVGKALWDAMSGIPLPGFDPKLVQDLKPHYEPVLRQHIEQTFLQGVTDQREGRAFVQAGAGIVADSVPAREYAESLRKAQAPLLAAARAALP